MLILAENFFGLTTATAPSKIFEVGTGAIISTSGSRYPTNSSGVIFTAGSTTHYLSVAIPSSNTLYTGLAFRAAVNPTTSTTFNLFQLRNLNAATLNHVSLQLKNGQLLLYSDNNTTLLGSYSIPSFSTANWYYVELGGFISGSGSVEVRLDGATAISASNVNTQHGTIPTVNNILLGVTANGGSLQVSASDWYVCDTSGSNSLTNTFLGDIRIVSLIPSQSGDQNDFMPLSASSALMIDDANQPDGDSTFVSASARNSMDLYKMTQYTGSATTVYGVAVNTYAKRTDSGRRELVLAIKSGSNISYSPSQSISFNYGWNSYGFDINPATSAPWASLQDIMNSQVGFKIVR